MEALQAPCFPGREGARRSCRTPIARWKPGLDGNERGSTRNRRPFNARCRDPGFDKEPCPSLECVRRPLEPDSGTPEPTNANRERVDAESPARWIGQTCGAHRRDRGGSLRARAGRRQTGAAGCPRLGRDQGSPGEGIARTQGGNGGNAQAPGERTQARSQGLGSPLRRTGPARPARPHAAGNPGMRRHRHGASDQAAVDPDRAEKRPWSRQVRAERRALVSCRGRARGAAGADETASSPATQGSEPGQGEDRGTLGLNQ